MARTFTAEGPDSIPGWRTKITGHVVWQKKMSDFVLEMREKKFRA